MCGNAGIVGHKTNHSLRATGVTEMYQGNAREKLIQERTGHQSLKALRVYERSTTEQHKAVSTLFSSEKESTFQQNLMEARHTSQNVDVQYQPAGSINISFQN